MSDDEHIAELQRRAYGADTPDSVRARAAAELAEFAALAASAAQGGSRPQVGADDGPARDAVAGDAVAGDPVARVEVVSDVVASDVVAGGAVVDEPAPVPADARSAGPDGTRSRVRRWAAAFGIAGLLVGAAAGTVVGRTSSAGPDVAPADVAPTGPAFGSGEPGTPLDDSGLVHLFDRLPPTAADGELGLAVSEMDPASLRLVATRTDGPAAYIARTVDGNDVCLILVVAPDGWVEYRCTSGGRLPAGGLRIQIAHPVAGFAVAILNSGGTLTLGLNAGR